MEKRLLTVQEVSDITGFAVGTLYHWATEGKIPCVRPNGSKRCLRFDPLAIEKWIRQNSTFVAEPVEKVLDNSRSDSSTILQ